MVLTVPAETLPILLRQSERKILLFTSLPLKKARSSTGAPMVSGSTRPLVCPPLDDPPPSHQRSKDKADGGSKVLGLCSSGVRLEEKTVLVWGFSKMAVAMPT